MSATMCMKPLLEVVRDKDRWFLAFFSALTASAAREEELTLLTLQVCFILNSRSDVEKITSLAAWFNAMDSIPMVTVANQRNWINILGTVITHCVRKQIEEKGIKIYNIELYRNIELR